MTGGPRSVGPGSKPGRSRRRFGCARRAGAAGAVFVALLLGLNAQAQGSGEIPARLGESPEQLDRGIHISSLPSKKVSGPSRKGGTYTARILIGTAVRRRPDRPRTVWYARTGTKWSGTGQRLMVLGSRRVRGETWLKVRLPVRPNGSSGWIPRDRVQLSHTNRFILVDISRRLLRVYGKGRVVVRHKVVVGAPSTPTPPGLFALHDRVNQADPNGFVGTWIVLLTAHSNKLRRYDGGPGLVAFHGRAGASLNDPLGSARSHGCIRMNNSRIASIARTMMGTAVKIRQ